MDNILIRFERDWRMESFRTIFERKYNWKNIYMYISKISMPGLIMKIFCNRENAWQNKKSKHLQNKILTKLTTVLGYPKRIERIVVLIEYGAQFLGISR